MENNLTNMPPKMPENLMDYIHLIEIVDKVGVRTVLLLICIILAFACYRLFKLKIEDSEYYKSKLSDDIHKINETLSDIKNKLGK